MIKLDRDEIKAICKLAERFQDIETFEIRQESSGIGISTTVRFLSGEEEEFPITTEIDITDYGKW